MELKYTIALFYVYLLSLLKVNAQEGTWPEVVKPKGKGCLMSGICYRYYDLRPKALNCLLEEDEDIAPSLWTNATAIMRLREFCADTLDYYGEEEGGGYELCCTVEQIDELSNLIIAKDFMARCPSCNRNFRQVFCELACSPYQIHFLTAAKIEATPGYVPGGPLKPRMVRELDLYHTSRYANQTYESCKDLKIGQGDTPAMDYLCGEYGSSRCSARNWYI